MDFKNQNTFGNQVFQNQVKFNQNPVLASTVTNLKAMSTDPNQKNQVLSTLARFQGQINTNDYNEILANVKSVDRNHILGEEKKELGKKKEITESDYQATVSSLRNLEYEMRKR